MTNEKANLHKDIFTSRIKDSSLREGYGDGIVEAARKNEGIVVLSADVTTSTYSHKFKEEYPERFFQVGVAEQNMAGIAAGLALEGKVPFIAAYAVFNPGRNLDQIRISICYSKANVKIIGSHAGLSSGPDGASHQALEDIVLMRTLPNIIVLVPCDCAEAKKAVKAAADYIGPVYIRLTREETPVFTTPQTPFAIGRSQVFMPGKDLTIFACGPVIYEALKAAQELKIKKGVGVEVVNVSTVKPLDEKTILESARKTRKVVTIEEHQISGGLGGAIAEFLSEKMPVPITRMGVKDSFGESGGYRELLEKYELSTEHIKSTILSLLI